MAPTEQQQQQQEKERSSRAAAADDEFEAILAPLEAEAGKRLNGAGRRWCRQAFTENREGLARCAADALERAHNPVGLLVRMIRDGDHLLPAPPSSSNGAPRQPKVNLSQYTGCRHLRGQVGTGTVYDPLGTEKPPFDWPHERPSRAEVLAALELRRSSMGGLEIE
jgi:hypothetical protein